MEEESNEELILRSLKYVISKNFCFNIKDLETSSNFTQDLGLDSIDFVELLMLVEESYDIVISESDELFITTIQDVVNLIILKQEGK